MSENHSEPNCTDHSCDLDHEDSLAGYRKFMQIELGVNDSGEIRMQSLYHGKLLAVEPQLPNEIGERCHDIYQQLTETARIKLLFMELADSFKTVLAEAAKADEEGEPAVTDSPSVNYFSMLLK